jgi:hypothetical protein
VRNAWSMHRLRSLWTDDDKAVLRTSLEIEPDMSPCDLAVICQKPCFEVSLVCVDPEKRKDAELEVVGVL